MANIPAFSLSLNGEDITDRFNPRLVSLTLTESREEKADQLDIELSDHDGKLEIPSTGVELTLQLGWRRGPHVKSGLIDKGRFKVDEAEHSGPPDRVMIRARSVDLTDSYRERKDRSFEERTVGSIIQEIAGQNGLQANVDPDLTGKVVPMIGPGAVSDMALARYLGRRFDATATVKAGKLIFAKIGKGSTATGKPLPGVLIRRSDGDSHSYRRVERDKYGGATAYYHNSGKAKRQSVKVGGGEGKAKRLRKTYANRADALDAASAEHARISRREAEMEINLAYANPSISPEQRVSLEGWKVEMMQWDWLVAEVTHTLDGSGGFTSALKLENRSR